MLINAEVERLQGESEKKVSQADVVSLAMVKWCSSDAEVGSDVSESRRAVAESAMHEAEAKSVAEIPVSSKRSESVAQRKARESKEHAAALAESDTVARIVGRDDISYDLENVPHRSVMAAAGRMPDVKPAERMHYEVANRKVNTLVRPHGNAEPKRRREQ